MKPSDLRVVLARRCLQLALVLCFIGIVLAFIAVWGERRAAAAAAWRDPANDLQPTAIAPDLALLSLAGTPDDQVLALAITTGELETVRALLTFSADLTDQQRVDGWLWLARRYQEAGQTHRAAQAYRLTGDGAVLSGHLPDLLRVETLLAVGRQLTALHDEPSARHYLHQAALLGAHAQNLTNHAQSSLLRRLIPASLLAGGNRDDWAALDKTVNSEIVQKTSITYAWSSITPGQDAALVTARDARRAAAAAWLVTMPNDDDQRDSFPLTREASQVSARHALHQALLAEDAAVNAYLKRRNDLVAQETQLRWLLLKRRIAAGGTIAGLVPEWESNREQIDAALTTAWADWLALYNKLNPNQAAHAARQTITATYWGLYPDASVTDLILVAQGLNNSNRLYLATATLANVRSGTLPALGWSEH